MSNYYHQLLPVFLPPVSSIFGLWLGGIFFWWWTNLLSIMDYYERISRQECIAYTVNVSEIFHQFWLHKNVNLWICHLLWSMITCILTLFFDKWLYVTWINKKNTNLKSDANDNIWCQKQVCRCQRVGCDASFFLWCKLDLKHV